MIFLTNFSQQTPEWIHFIGGMVAWYNHIKGKEVLILKAKSGIPREDFDYLGLFTVGGGDLNYFWEEYKKERVKRNIWYPFEDYDRRLNLRREYGFDNSVTNP